MIFKSSIKKSFVRVFIFNFCYLLSSGKFSTVWFNLIVIQVTYFKILLFFFILFTTSKYFSSPGRGFFWALSWAGWRQSWVYSIQFNTKLLTWKVGAAQWDPHSTSKLFQVNTKKPIIYQNYQFMPLIKDVKVQPLSQ